MSPKQKHKKHKPDPPVFTYPATPYTVGLDRLVLRVRQPAKTAALYQAMGFSRRGTASGRPVLGVVSLAVELARAADADGSGTVFQLACDNVDAKRQELVDAGLEPGPTRKQRRGDRAFEWQDPDGYTFRFTGPARRADDPVLADDQDDD